MSDLQFAQYKRLKMKAVLINYSDILLGPDQSTGIVDDSGPW